VLECCVCSEQVGTKEVVSTIVPTTAELFAPHALELGEIPAELTGLSPMEKRLISRCIPVFTVLPHLPVHPRVHGAAGTYYTSCGGRHEQRAVIGGMVHLRNDVAAVAKVLPRSPYDCGWDRI